MVQFDNQYRQIKLKVVYYGPALGGKTTCLQHIHRVTDPQRRSKLYTLATAADRTLFFDLITLDLGRVRGYRLTMQLYTVPGQVQYNATRRAVLAGADGVVFVADSQRSQERANAESLANLVENLRANGLDADTIPCVLQFNKRDLEDVLTRSELEQSLNRRSYPSFETVATTGAGVVEAFAAITKATVLAVADRLGLSSQPDALGRLAETVRTALLPLLRGDGRGAVEAPVVIRPAAKSALLEQEELIAEAVRANVAMTDLNALLDRLSRDLERRVFQLRAINEFGRTMSVAREPADVIDAFLDRFLGELGVSSGSLLLVGEDGGVVEAARRGLSAEPALQPDGAGTAAQRLLEARVGVAVRVDERDPEQAPLERWVDTVMGMGFAAALAVPLVVQDRPLGLAVAYAEPRRGAFEREELDLATVLASNAAAALASVRSWRSIEDLNRILEEKVAERTLELEEALGRTRELADQLEERNLALEEANRQLRELDSLKSDLLNRIAHELNTPVTAILTAARILSRADEVPADKISKFVEIIASEAGRLAELIAAALQVVVLGAPESRPRPTEVPVAELLRRALAPLKGEIARRSLTAQVKVATGLDHLTGDAEQLETALRAVVRNAVEFNREGGTVTVTVRPVRRAGAHFVELRVTDTGVGIAAADLPHVTELFWQGGQMLTEKPKGLGLGLAIARRVAENHGGTLEVSSEPERGTAVTVLLPAARGAAE